MPGSKTFVCLANSFKPPSGRCVAGRMYDGNQFGDWIRPVSTRGSREISEEERSFEDGRDPRVLDLLRVKFSEHSPLQHQTENHAIDDDYYWKHIGQVTWHDIQRAVENPDSLWKDSFSSYFGINDRVPENLLGNYTNSLYLIRPTDVQILVALEKGYVGDVRRRVRANFRHNGVEYQLSVTDPRARRAYLARENGTYPLEDAHLCISLAEPYKGYAYKLAAAVITHDTETK